MPTYTTLLDLFKDVVSGASSLSTSGGAGGAGGVGGIATSTLTQVSVTALSTTILALNASRKKIILFNDGANTVYVAFGATATTAAYTFKLQPNAYYESQDPVYTGAISGITASSTSNIQATEILT